MSSPRTYRGYGSNNELIVSKTGADANNQINPAEVKKEIDNVKAVFDEQMKGIAKSLRDISQDSAEAIIVEGTKMDGTIEETAQVLSQLGAQVTQGIDELHTYAIKAHDALQDNNNAEAYNACARTNGVARVE